MAQSGVGSDDLQRKLEGLQRLHRVSLALSQERNRSRLMERVLLEAKDTCRADGGTLYLRTEDDELEFEIMRTDSLDIALGGTTGKAINLPKIPLYDAKGEPNHRNVASYAATAKKSVNIADAYNAEGFDFSGTKSFDERSGYRSTSFLTIPMLNHHQEVIGILQLLNSRCEMGEVCEFSAIEQEIVEAIASQAAVALENQLLLSQQRKLMEAFIKLIAAAIDAKSPYTGGHCRRVPVLTEMIAKSACEAESGGFADFNLSDEEWYELHIAGWLHDCGKITTPVHVMDKATKLETIFDRIEIVRARFAAKRAAVKIDYLEKRARLKNAGSKRKLKKEFEEALEGLGADLKFLEKVNIGGEFLDDAKKKEIRRIAKIKYPDHRDRDKAMLSKEEVKNLSISRGTLTDEERVVINGHMVQTLRMLEALPFPKGLKRVPEYASNHHEKMDGTGYPRGIYAGDLSAPARMMAVADVFEALTASDRPYKKGKTLSESLGIMAKMTEFNHLDPEVFRLFVEGGVYLEYAKKFLSKAQIDTIDVGALLKVESKSFDVPASKVRQKRFEDFLPEYRELLSKDNLDLSVTHR